MTDTLEKAKQTAEHWSLGQTSANYESGSAGPGAISTGKGDHGGVSYKTGVRVHFLPSLDLGKLRFCPAVEAKPPSTERNRCLSS